MPWEFPRLTDWIEAAERWAYGPLELLPQEFVALTPRQFELLCAGYAWRHERFWDGLAFLATLMVNVQGPKSPAEAKHFTGRQIGESRVRGYR